MCGIEQPRRPACSLWGSSYSHAFFTPAKPGSSLKLRGWKCEAEGAALRGAGMLASEEGECSVWCGHIVSGRSGQMFVTFGFTMLPKNAKQTCSSVGNLCRNLLSARFSLPALPAGASWILLSFILWSCFIKASTVRGCRAQRLTKIRYDLWFCLQVVSRYGDVWHTNWLKSGFASPKCSYVCIIVCKVLCSSFVPVRTKQQHAGSDQRAPVK